MKRTIAVAALCMSAMLSAHADIHVLHCQPDSAPDALGLRLQLDTEAGTLTHLFPGDAKPMHLPMREAGAEWLGESRLPKDVGELKAGTLMISIAVDRYTLRFTMYNKMGEAFATNSVTRGQCKRLEKQL